MRVSTGKKFTENIIMGIFFAGVIAIASPYFVATKIPEIIKCMIRNRRERRSFSNTFSRLKKNGLINIDNRNGQIYISLTKEGKKRAGKYQIDNLEIKNPGKWDRKWRVLIFDVKEKQRIKRDALRGKIKELGLYKLQNSVWAYPYDFFKEAKLLRDFFGLTGDEMQIITNCKLEKDKELKKNFQL